MTQKKCIFFLWAIYIAKAYIFFFVTLYIETQSLRFHCDLLYSAGEVVPFKRPLLLATPYSIPSLSCYSSCRNSISEIISIFVSFWCKSSCQSVQATFNSLTGQKELYWRKFNPFPSQYIRCIVKDGIILNMFC